MIFIANWKMNLNKKETLELTKNIVKKVKIKKMDIILCPSFTALFDVQKILSNSNIKLGAQDVFWKKNGAFTGEISASMLKEAGCQYVIIGHSDRRLLLKETDEMINKKIKSCLKFGLIPILCIGEKSLKTNKPSIDEQLKKDLKGVSQKEIKKVIIVYEPTWAIGTGNYCQPDQALKKIKIIKNIFNSKFKIQNLKVLYGGSVDSKNINDYLKNPEINGVLVGGASLKINEIVKMIN
ncbi:MAG: triose-phosphate isomerase [Patescibacteria group bacterium]